MLNERLDVGSEGFVVAPVHVCRNWAWVDSIDGASLCQLPGPRPRHALEGCLGSTVDRLPLKSQRRADGREVDDASRAISGQVLYRSLQQQQRAPHIDVELSGKVLAVNILDIVVARDTGVVDNHVELELAALRVRKIVLGDFDKVLRPIFGAHARLHCQRLDSILGGQLRGKVLGGLGGRVGGVVEDEVAAFVGQVARDFDADTCNVSAKAAKNVQTACTPRCSSHDTHSALQRALTRVTAQVGRSCSHMGRSGGHVKRLVFR